MARNWVQEAEVVTVTAPAAVKSGDVVVVGRLCGIAACDADMGAPVEIGIEGAFLVPLTGATVGVPVFWSGSALTVTASTNMPVGIALADSTVGGLAVVKLCPYPGPAGA